MAIDIEKILMLAKEHHSLSPDRIVLSNSIGDNAEMRRSIALQVAMQSTLARKLPSWASKGIYIPSQLNLEQCSSEVTALYKQSLVQPDDVLMDLTGGLAVDFWAMCSKASKGIYIEENPSLYEATCHNLEKLLDKTKIETLCANSMEVLEELCSRYEPSLIYVDPARREGQQRDKRVYAIEDCTPSLHELIECLVYIRSEKCQPRIIAKLSPMLDIKHTLRTLPCVECVRVVSVRGEVKELLLEINPYREQPLAIEDVSLIAINLSTDGIVDTFSGNYSMEQGGCAFSNTLKTYLYEPNGAVMKVGLYCQIGNLYEVEKLHPHTHLYTSDTLIPNFPGRKLRVEELIPYQSKQIKGLKKKYPKAQITCRNFPLDAEKLRAKLGISDSSEATIVATTLYDGSKVLVLCSKA